MSTTPHIKFENSPADSLADSFVSTPGTQYPSLFANNTMDPAEVMTPQSYEDDSMFGGSVREESMVGDTPGPEKKQVKKRKSWGQQLPEPKTNLPPRYILDNKFTIVDYSANPLSRKRAKTEDEKEQRRVERVLRNRRAAQSSRERKRQEVEALEAEKRQIERRNQDLEMRLAHMEEQYLHVRQQLEQVTGNKMIVFGSSSVVSTPSQELHQASSPVTFSQELFSSRDSNGPATISRPSISETQSPQTVNPASLSPEIRPVVESTNACSSDMTQHPAAMLCDLQCQSEEQRPWMNSRTPTTLAISQILVMTTFLNMISATTSTILSPLSQIITSLRTGSSLSPTTSILTLIIWLVTTTAALTTSTLMTFSTTTTSLRRRLSLRIRLLRRLLACSPNLARPLMDATVVAMRSASEQQLTHDCLSGVDASVRHVGASSPSVESLMTLLWAIHVIEKEREQKEKAPKLDAATEVRQACGELDELFRPRNITQNGVSYLSGERATRKKSLEDWRMAFKHHHH
jgi:transcriptional activator HAC1